MTEYLVSLFAVAAVICVSGFVAYRGGSDASVKFALGVILIYTVLMPVTELFGEGELVFDGEYEFNPEDYTKDYEEVAKEAFCQGIKMAVCEKYSLSEGEVSLSTVGFSFNEMRAARIRITLSGAAALSDYKSIERYVCAMGRGECEVKIEIG